MSQILKALVALKSTNENLATRNEEATSDNLVAPQLGVLSIQFNNQGTRMVPAGWPPYGLPWNYTPHYEEHPEQGVPPPVTHVNPSGTPVGQQELVQVQPNIRAAATNVAGPQSLLRLVQLFIHRQLTKEPK